MRGNQGRYSNIRISYKTKSLYIQGHGHSISQGNGSVIDARMGINKVQVRNIITQIYINGEHMVAGSEVDKRQDFTIIMFRVGSW